MLISRRGLFGRLASLAGTNLVVAGIEKNHQPVNILFELERREIYLEAINDGDYMPHLASYSQIYHYSNSHDEGRKGISILKKKLTRFELLPDELRDEKFNKGLQELRLTIDTIPEYEKIVPKSKRQTKECRSLYCYIEFKRIGAWREYWERYINGDWSSRS